MSDLNKRIRHKRFILNSDSDVRLIIETKTNHNYNLGLRDCSLVGLGGQIALGDVNFEDLEIGDLIESSKITWKNHEYALGKLIVRSSRKEQQKNIIGFSTVDNKVPIDGPLSKFIDKEILDTSSPYDFELNSDKFNIASFLEADQANIDLFARCRQFKIFMNDWLKNPKYQYNTVRKPSLGIRIKLTDRRKNGRNDFIVMGSNDYLGLASHPKVLEASKKAIDDYGYGSTGSHLLTGTCEIHEELCEYIGKIYKKEKVLLFSSGYAANLGAIQGLTAPNDIVVADMLAHASLQDGMKMSHATSRFYKHNSMEHLEKILTNSRSDHNGCLIITEGIFSMDGDVAPMSEVVKVARKHNSRVLVDEAHALGILGETGLGTCEQDNVIDKVDIIMGNTSKTLGSLGGFLAGSEDVMYWLTWFARSRMFSTSMPPASAAAALTAFQIMMEKPELIQDVQRNIRHFVKGMIELGAPLDRHHSSAIVPIVIGDDIKLGKMNQELKDKGVYVHPIIYPAVSRKGSRFRFTLCATHTISDLDYVLSAFQRAMEIADFSFKSSSDQDKKELKAA